MERDNVYLSQQLLPNSNCLVSYLGTHSMCVQQRLSSGKARREKRLKIILYTTRMLPAPAQFHYVWEISSGNVTAGSTVRTFGRLSLYDPARSEAMLTAYHSATQHKLCLNTRFVEPFSAQIGSYYLALGELDSMDEKNLVLYARLLTCIEGVDLSLLQNAVEEQRRYFLEREAARTNPLNPV
ncbi:CST complex subunit TEN1 isoform X2 [Hyla sarda]|uniref:CST complex subunit TEN1 isoform X2 n=1 Tax=Hyla sarda TaxID=327740 RepID=UPI0024C469EA|nr:CST complex subunit TEN1 isoform X2 [Hyla sarda]